MSQNQTHDITTDIAEAPRWGWRWGLVLVTALAAGLRVFRLDHGGLWYDELIMVRLTSGSLAEIWRDIVEGRPALYPLLAWGWEAVFGHRDAAVRALSAGLGTLTVPVVY
ncbi:MAG: hypothetical protein AAGL98_03110, partial [Planctomycetota bacterium]